MTGTTKRIKGIAAATAACLFLSGCAGSSTDALFTDFTYCGHDSRFDRDMDPSGQYFNPVLAGFFPDPAICRKGDDYYLVNSSFSFYPGIPIFHSKDLVHWKQHGFVLNRPSQLNLDGIRMDGGVYAPSISYNPHDGLFYVVNTIVDGIGNFYVTAEDPLAGNWSDPVLLPELSGIDPSFFFDEDGKAYVVYNGECPGTPQWDGHRAIWMYEFDYKAKKVTGDRLLLVDGGVDPCQHPVWIEGPHLMKKDGHYVLFCAEGGTNEGHSEVAFTSDNVKGPFRPARINPIITQRDLSEDRADKVTCTGHADIVDTPDGDWWAVFLGCRPYMDKHYNTGRETFMLPVEWVDGAPVILPQGESVPAVVDKPGLAVPEGYEALTGNFSWSDSFVSLSDRWMQIRTPHQQWWNIGNGLRITPRKSTIYDRGENPSFMGVRQQHASFEAAVKMDFTPYDAAVAGLAVYQKEHANYVIGKQLLDGMPSVVLYRTEGSGPVAVASEALRKASEPLELKLSVDKSDITFCYREDSRSEWKQLGEVQDARILSTDSADGFTGVMVGCYASLNTRPAARLGAMRWMASTDGDFSGRSMVRLRDASESDEVLLDIDTEAEGTIFNNWGTTFNELNWVALSMLSEKDREEALFNFFDPKGDLRFTRGRIPLGADDYARSWYSCDEVEGDFGLRCFSIDRDRECIIPYIRSAQRYNPDLTFWISPWSPPSWMKINGDYPVRSSRYNNFPPELDYLLYEYNQPSDPDVIALTEQRENVFPARLTNTDYFIQEPRYLQAYADYFSRFIDEYGAEGIPVDMVMYQNEAYSYTPYPGCPWTVDGTVRFNSEYLAPTLKKNHPEVKIYLGTLNTNRQDHVEALLSHKELLGSISGIGFQWEGREILAEIRRQYPQLAYMQSESECGSGTFDWPAGEHTFELINHYLGNGVSDYIFWNGVLADRGESPWGWKQNALIHVDSKSGKFRYTPEYYAVRHYSQAIAPGSHILAYHPEDEVQHMPVLVARNPDGRLSVVAGNFSDSVRTLRLRLSGKILEAQLAPHSMNSFLGM